jgi:hypothetical protein
LANYANLGERYIHTGRLIEGRDVLQKGIDLDPENFLCYTNMAAFWIQVRDIKKGLYYTQKSIELGKLKSSWFIVQAMRNQQKEVRNFQSRYNREVYFPEVGKKEEPSVGAQVSQSQAVKEAEHALAVG